MIHLTLLFFNYTQGVNSYPSVRVPVERHIAGSGVDDNVNVLTNSIQMLVYSNCSIMGDLYEYPNAWERNVSYFAAEYNYLVGQDGNGSDASGSSDENEENNMYLKSADFKFNIHKYGDIENNDSTADNYDFAMANMSYKNYWGNKERFN